MSMINPVALRDSVVLVIKPNGDHQQRFIGLNIREAHDLVTDLLEVIESAQGFQDAMAGKVQTPTDCRNCKARNITPRHVCKKVRG